LQPIDDWLQCIHLPILLTSQRCESYDDYIIKCLLRLLLLLLRWLVDRRLRTFLWFVATCYLHRRRRRYVFTSVFLVWLSDNWKSCERILTKFHGRVGHRPGTKWLNFGDDLDHRPDPGVRSPKSGFTGLSKKYLVGSDQSCMHS